MREICTGCERESGRVGNGRRRHGVTVVNVRQTCVLLLSRLPWERRRLVAVPFLRWRPWSTYGRGHVPVGPRLPQGRWIRACARAGQSGAVAFAGKYCKRGPTGTWPLRRLWVHEGRPGARSGDPRPTLGGVPARGAVRRPAPNSARAGQGRGQETRAQLVRLPFSRRGRRGRGMRAYSPLIASSASPIESSMTASARSIWAAVTMSGGSRRTTLGLFRL